MTDARLHGEVDSEDSFEEFLNYKHAGRRHVAPAPAAPAAKIDLSVANRAVPQPAEVLPAVPAKDKQEAAPVLNSNDAAVSPKVHAPVASAAPPATPKPATLAAPAAMEPKAVKAAPAFGCCPFCDTPFESGVVPRCNRCGASTVSNGTKKAGKPKKARKSAK